MRVASTTAGGRRCTLLLSEAATEEVELLRSVLDAGYPSSGRFYAESGAPEGALYVDGELVGYLPGVQRLFHLARAGAFGRLVEVRAGFLHSSDLDPTKPINWKRQNKFCGEIGVMGDLGLHVVHNIVTEHHGAIEVDTAPGHGSTFHVWLPAARAEAPPATPMPLPARPLAFSLAVRIRPSHGVRRPAGQFGEYASGSACCCTAPPDIVPSHAMLKSSSAKPVAVLHR